VAVLTLVGLGLVLWRGLQARPAAARALAEGLGPRWPDELTPELSQRLARHRPWGRLLFAPLAVRRRDVVRHADLSYGPAGRSNLLDVYERRGGPATGPCARPCLVYFHGGGYRSGRKNREARALIYHLASLGWVCVSADYRLAGAAPYPAQLADAKRVIAWVRDHAWAYGADASTLVVAGSSAGAHLAAMAALTPNVPTLQPGFEQADTHVDAAICLYGFYGAPNWIDREPGAPAAPIGQLERGGPRNQDPAAPPPMLIAHGTHDSFVSVGGARNFVTQFRRVAPQRPLVYLELPGAQHTFDLYDSVRFRAVIDAVDVFIEHLKSTVSSSSG
jgi:acetyl esterase/lipase